MAATTGQKREPDATSAPDATRARTAPEGGPMLPPVDMEITMLGMARSMVSQNEFQQQKADYEAVFAKHPEDTPEYREDLNACHDRGAERAVKIVQLHRGVYVKAAQFVASLRGGTGDAGIPAQYTEALKIFTDHAPSKPAGAMKEVLADVFKLGQWPEGPLDESCALKWIESTPLASASLAQVHRAELRDGTKVAVKLQYPELRKEMAGDFNMFRQLGAAIKPGGYDLMWIVEDLEKYLNRELDFSLEASSGETTARQLKHLAPRVFVPRVLHEFSSQRVLTMEFCEGLLKINDPELLRKNGLDPMECAELLCETFAEMIFVHGRVHADPHAGNVYVRPRKDENGQTRPQLVILDHGLYHDLADNDVRLHFCRYWQACCTKNSGEVQRIGTRFAGVLQRFLPLVLSPWFVFGGSGVTLKELLSASRGQLPDSVSLKDVADFIVATRDGGANLIGLLHSLGYTRGLLQALGYPESRRLSTMLKFAILGDSPSPDPVPRALTAREGWWLQWQMATLGWHIRLLAPLAQPLIRYLGMERAPPLWLVAMLPVMTTGVGAYVLLQRRNSSSRLEL